MAASSSRDHARRTGEARFSSDAAAASAATPSSWRAPRSSWAAGLASVAGSAGSAMALGQQRCYGAKLFVARCSASLGLPRAAGCFDGLVRGPMAALVRPVARKIFGFASGPGRVSSLKLS